MNTVVAKQIRSAVEARMRELAPVLSEFQQLQSVLTILDDPDACNRLIDVPGLSTPSGVSLLHRGQTSAVPAIAAHVAQLRNPGRLGNKPGVDGRAPQGANKQRILAVIGEQPGIAAPQVAKLTGMKRSVVASTISRLKRTGELRAHGEGVCLTESAACLGLVQEGAAQPLYVAIGSG
ncbi:MAG TPA: helix-turn-helix domain-containing protein [Solirubrobacteraceae bacterium]|nr:helix-turn-helix domain-containing protein [Solirubrobacteraceae bacterium]